MAGYELVDGPEPYTYPSESAAVQDWIDGNPITCRCGRPLGRADGAWFHADDGSMIYCRSGRDAGPSIADTECGACGRKWDSILTPTPAARCPWEADHDDEDEPDPDPTLLLDLARVLELAAELAEDLADTGDDPLVGPDDIVVGRAWAEALVRAAGIGDDD